MHEFRRPQTFDELNVPRDFPGVQQLRLCLPVQEVWVQSLVREPRSHMTHSQKKKKNEIENRNNIVINSIKTLKMVYIKKKS